MTEYTAPLPRWKPALAFYHFLARYPLRVTFPAFMVAGFLVMLVDTYVHEIRTNREHALVQMTSQVITTSREAAAHFSHALYNQHAGDVGSTLNALALEGDFEAGALVDEDGKLLAASGAQAAGSSFDKKNFGLRGDHELGASTEVIGSFMYSVVPVMSPAQEGRPSRQIARFYRRDRTAAVLANAHAVARSEAARHTLEFGLVMLLLWWVGERVYRARLSCIETAASAVSGGELGVRVNLIGCDELTRLAHAFNDMVGKLEADRARALAQSEALETSNAELEALRSALDAHAIVSMTDEFGAIVHANDKFCEISGYGRDELLGQNHSLLKSGVHGEEVYRQLWTTIRDGRAWHGVLQNRRKDGTPYWVQSSILPLGSKTATHGGYISLRTDITERERLRVALERLARTDTMQAPFDLFSEALAFGLDASRTAVVRFVENNQRQRLLGSWPASAEPEESIVQGCAAAIRDGAAGFSQCTCLTTSFPHDPLLVGHDQDCLFVEPIIDLTGAPIGMLYAIRPCRPADESSMRALLSTVARRAAGEIQLLSMERAQVRQQAWLEFVMQGAGAAVWDRDLITGAVKFNEQFAKMLGYELAELEPVVDTWQRAIHADDVAAAVDAVDAHLAGETDRYQAEYRLRTRHGDYIWVLDRGAITVRAPDGRPLHLAGVQMDITEVREQEAEHERLRLQIQQAQKMEAVGQLAGGIAHDFNNILASVIGFGSLARERFARDADSKLAEYLNAVITAGERGRDLVAKMLSFSRATPSGQAQALEPVAVAREVAHLLSTIIPSSIHFDLDVHEPVPMVSIDAVDIHQVLVNLVVNARDAVSSHGHIRITVDGKAARQGHCAACQAPINGEYVAITVRDDGCGMDERTVARIFDPFYTTKDVGKGTGMGLSVVHGIMHRAGGHVMVNSTPGAGTEFVMLLRPASGTINSVSTEVRPAVSVAGLRVLVVDDEPLVRNFIGELLQGEGARPTLAADGREAQAMFAATPADFDVVFTDQTMPGLTGLELTAALREARADVPVVLCSGYSDRATRDVARAGGVIFLGKPAESQAILDALHTAVQGARH